MCLTLRPFLHLGQILPARRHRHAINRAGTAACLNSKRQDQQGHTKGQPRAGRLRVKHRLLLIGGAAGTGKSIVARTLATRLNAAWLQLDTLWIAMRDAAPQNSKERALLDIEQRIRAQAEPAEVLLDHHIAASETVCAALPHALGFELQTHPTVVADGAWLIPEFAAQLDLDDVNIRSVFSARSRPSTGCAGDVLTSRRRHGGSVACGKRPTCLAVWQLAGRPSWAGGTTGCVVPPICDCGRSNPCYHLTCGFRCRWPRFR
jgi:hypothetical protein